MGGLSGFIYDAQTNPAFTPVASTVGGLILGAVSSFHLLSNGRVTGISGILHGALFGGQTNGYQPQAAFASGLMAGAATIKLFYPKAFSFASAGGSSQVLSTVGCTALACVAGLLVGFGTRMGSGCTSGHGVSGLPRLSSRSIVAVGSFMTTGMLSAIATGAAFGGPVTVLTGVHVPAPIPLSVAICAAGGLAFLSLGSNTPSSSSSSSSSSSTSSSSSSSSSAAAATPLVDSAATWLVSCISGFGFAWGLAVSGMASPLKVVSFLDPVYHRFDPSLMCVLGAAVGFNLIAFRMILKRKRPLFLDRFSVPTRTEINSDLVIGAGIFGAGWGMAGICPGPGLVALCSGDIVFFPFMLSLLGGMRLQAMMAK